jgi:r-opsin
MPPLFGWNRFILEGFGTSCTFDYISKDLWDHLFILILVTGGFLIPLSIILFSYAFILIKLSQRSRSLTSQSNYEKYSNQLSITNENQVRSATTAIDCTDDNNITRNILRRTEVRATRTALLICAVFCSAWGPYALMALISLFGFNYLVNAYTTAMLGMFTKVAACINPLIYALSLNGFREQICLYFKCICQCEKYHHPVIIRQSDLINRSHL